MTSGARVSTDVEFDPVSEEYFTGAERTYRRLRDEAPVYRNEDQDFYALSRYDDVAAAYKDWQTYPSSKGIMLDQMCIPGFDGTQMPGFLGLYDPPLHLRMRTLTSSALTPSKVGDLEAAVRTAVATRLDELAQKDTPDFVNDYAIKFGADVLYRLMGIPAEDYEHVLEMTARFQSAGEEGQESATNPGRAQATMDMVQYFYGLGIRKRQSDADDVITRMVKAHYVDENGEDQALTDPEVGGYLMQLFAAGVESSAKLTTGTFVQLHRTGNWKKIVADPSLIPAALAEAGRLEPPVQFLGRKTSRDVTLHGTTIPAGASVLLLMAAANRDDRVYEDPDEFRLDRVLAKPPLTFGAGPHACMGKHLADHQGHIALAEFARRFPEASPIEEGLKRARAVHTFGWQDVPLRLA
jgi:cytochrome P450